MSKDIEIKDVEEKKYEWDVLNKVGNAFAGMLKCLYAIKFICKKELTDLEKEQAFKCLNIIAEDEKNDKDARCFCYNQLGLILSGNSNFI